MSNRYFAPAAGREVKPTPEMPWYGIATDPVGATMHKGSGTKSRGQ